MKPKKNKSSLKQVNIDTIPNIMEMTGKDDTARSILRLKFNANFENMIARYKELPAIIVEYGRYSPLLLEARELFIEGKFYSCVAMCGISAERIAKEILRNNIKIKRDKKKWTLPSDEQSSILDRLDMYALRELLVKSNIIDISLRKPFTELAELRNKYAHALQINPKKDAKAAIDYLHQIIEGTVSVIGKYKITNRGVSLE